MAFGSREITSAPMWTMNDAMENATNAVKSFAEVAGETLPAGTDVTKLEDAVKAVTSATSEYTLYVAMIAFFGVVLVVLSNTTDPNTGMDEWAALAAKEGEEEPEALQAYDPKVIRGTFRNGRWCC